MACVIFPSTAVTSQALLGIIPRLSAPARLGEPEAWLCTTALAISSPAFRASIFPSLSHETEVGHDGRGEQVLHLPSVVEDELVVGGEGGVHVRRGPPRRRVVRPGRAGKTVAAGQLQLRRHYDYKFIKFSITTPRLRPSWGSISDGDM